MPVHRYVVRKCRGKLLANVNTIAQSAIHWEAEGWGGGVTNQRNEDELTNRIRSVTYFDY